MKIIKIDVSLMKYEYLPLSDLIRTFPSNGCKVKIDSVALTILNFMLYSLFSSPLNPISK